MIVEHIKYGMVAVGYEHLEGVRDNVTSLSNLTAVGLERSKTISGGTKQTNTQILTAMAQGRRMQKKPLVEASVLTFFICNRNEGKPTRYEQVSHSFGISGLLCPSPHPS